MINETIIEGYYKAKLIIPDNSSLNQSDIDSISSIVTWREDPNELGGVILSGRSVIINNEFNIGLQISGVGYLPVVIGINNDSAVGYEEEVFLKPSNKNFLKEHKSKVMGMTKPSNRKSIQGVNYYELINHYPQYKPAGTYDYNELSNKVKFTSEVLGLNLKKMFVPRVEAYGFYLSDELRDANGPFGFIVTTTPGKDKLRFAQELFNQHAGVMDLMTGLSSLAVGLRELHDNGYAHLSPHASNFYLVNDKPYLMDWSTACKLGSDKELNLVYRAIDLIKLVNNLESLLGVSTVNKSAFLTQGMSMIMSSYVDRRIDLFDLFNRAARFKNKPGDFDVLIQLMLDYDVESFTDKPKKILVKTADENMGEFMKKNRVNVGAPKKLNKFDRARQKITRAKRT